MMAPRKRRIMLIGLALILIALMYPRKSVLASEYIVTVADSKGHTLAGVVVRRFIQDYSSGGDVEHSIEAVTDPQGHASFPEEDHRASVAGAFSGCVRQFLQSGAHASCGVYSDISVDNNHLVEAARLETSLQHGVRSLVFTMSPCPSGDYWACTNSARTRKSSVTP